MSLTKVKAGNILLTTPSASSNDVTPATTQYVTTALANMVDSAPSTLNTLNELAAALGDDANFSTTVTNSIAAKAPLASPTLTGNPKINVGTNKNIIFSGGIGEIGSVPGFQAINDAGSANTDFGIRATTIRLATGSAERMRIDSSGKVGIGNSTPGNSHSNANLLVVGSGSAGGMALYNGANAGGYYFARDNANNTDAYDGGMSYDGSRNLKFHTNAGSARMTITGTGNVGIGRTPSYPLDISGISNDLTPLLRGTATNTPSGGFNWATEFIAANLSNNTRLTHIWGKARTTYGMAHISYMPKSTASASMLSLGLWGANDIVNILGTRKVIIGDDESHVDDMLQIQTPASGGGHGIQIRRDDSNGDQGIGRIMFGNNNDTDLATINAVTDGQADSARLVFSTQATSGNSTERMRITSAGHVAIVSGRRFYLNVNSIGNGDTYIDEYSANEVGITTGGSRKIAVSGGNLYVSGSVNANHNFSDERLKENIVVIPNALQKVSSLRGITFTRKDDGSVGTGLIAQELETVLPEAVYEAKMVEELENPDAESWKSINYGNTVGLLVEAIKELEARIATLEG